MALKWGIVSTGKICSDFCSALKTLPADEHEIVSVVSRSLESAEKFADKFGIRKKFSSYEEFASDPDIEVVYIGSVLSEHVKLCLLMLDAGKHVLCEKPMAKTLEEVKMVNSKAKEKNLFFMEAVWSRCFPVYHKVREEISSGQIGDVQMVTAQFSVPLALQKNITSLTGGILLEVGIYPIQFACYVYGESPISITAVGDVIETGHDIDGCIILTYSKGQKACLMYNCKVHSFHGFASIEGTKGSIEFENYFWCPISAKLPSGETSNPIPEGPVPYNFPNTGGLCYEATEVKNCIREGLTEYPYYTHADSEMVHCIMDEVAKQIGRK